MTHRIAWLDVFAERPLAGNGLAVVDAADDITDATMQAFARETGLSETTFVQAADADGAEYRNRIFTIEAEIPFAGHPSLGTAVAVARWRGAETANFVQQTRAGLQPIEVDSRSGSWRAEIVQNAAEFGTEVDPAEAMRAVGLDPDAAHPDHPSQVVSTGLPAAIVPLADSAALPRAKPDFDAIDRLLEGAQPRIGETPSFYLTWFDPKSGEAHARMFHTAATGGEDPATGSAAGPLGAYVAERADCERLTIRQGETMGRPSLLEVKMVDGRPRVGGGVIPLIDGEISLP